VDLVDLVGLVARPVQDLEVVAAVAVAVPQGNSTRRQPEELVDMATQSPLAQQRLVLRGGSMLVLEAAAVLVPLVGRAALTEAPLLVVEAALLVVEAAPEQPEQPEQPVRLELLVRLEQPVRLELLVRLEL
jgi:hypothetical protein